MAINVERWIEKSGIDYYICFIKAWIPFNAWFMKEYFDEDANIVTDRKILDKIKEEPNQFKSKIVSLISSSGEESDDFKMHLFHLHKSLLSHPLSNGHSLSFDNICISLNSNKEFTTSFGKKTYKGVYDEKKKRTENRFSVECMKKDGKTITKIDLPNCIEETLTTHPEFSKCSEKDQEYLKKCLEEIFPKKPVSIIGHNPKKRIHIFGDLYFVNDKNLIAKAIIAMFYELRCKLFHGELDPTDSNSSTYRHAYHMLHTLSTL